MGNMKKEKLPKELLKLAAGKYMERQGEKLVEEHRELDKMALLKQPTVKQMREFKKICKREFRKKNRRIALFYKVAASAAVLLLIFNISVVSVPAVKRVVLDFLISSEETHTKINISDSERSTIRKEEEKSKYRFSDTNEYEITYLPEGFQIEKEEKTSSILGISYKYDDKYILFLQKNDSTTVNIDTENAIVDYVDINGENAILSEKDDTINITWRKEDYFLHLSSKGLEKKELIKVAKSIKNGE